MRQRTMLSMVCGVAALSAVVGAQVIQTRDQVGPPRAAGNAPMPGGTGAIAGVILSDEANPQPLRRVTVTVSGDGFSRSTLTDDRGRFQIDGLPAARLNLAATKPGYVRAAYGAKRPDRPGTAITLADAQRVTDITLKLARGSVITGTILDELGMPAVGAGVRAMQYRLQPGGERALVPATSGQMLNEVTDDRGSYRLYGLAAGEYVIVAAPRMPEGGEVRAMSDAEIRAAMAALQQPPGMPGGRGAGGYPSAPNTTPQAASDVVTIGYSPVFYPGTTLAARAGSITVGVGEERTGVDFALSIVRTARIEGSVVMPQGVSPQNVSLLMVSSNAAAMAGGDLINSTRVGPDGKFTYTNVAPGQYTITARTGGRSNVMTFGPGGGTAIASFVMATPGGGRGNGGTGANANAPMSADPTPQLWGMTDVSVDGQNLNNVSISLQPGMTLTGRLAFEGVKMTPPTDLSRARVTLTPVASGTGVSMALGSAEIDAAGKFAIAGLTPGKYRFTANVPSDGALGSWTLKSATAGGRDALDVPLDLAPNEVISNAVVTFTDATQEVSGRLQDASGRPAPDFTMVVFPADTRYWLPQARRIKTARPSTDGRFVVPGLPPGDYRIAAVLDIAPNEANDPAFLQQLLQAAVPFTLAPGEKHVQDFKIGGV